MLSSLKESVESAMPLPDRSVGVSLNLTEPISLPGRSTEEVHSRLLLYFCGVRPVTSPTVEAAFHEPPLSREYSGVRSVTVLSGLDII